MFGGRILGGTLTHEMDGTTDEARWFAMDEIAALPRVPLVDTAIGFVLGTN